MTPNECQHPFHQEDGPGSGDNAEHIEYVTLGPGPDMMMSGFECVACGFRTMLVLDKDDQDRTDEAIIERYTVAAQP